MLLWNYNSHAPWNYVVNVLRIYTHIYLYVHSHSDIVNQCQGHCNIRENSELGKTYFVSTLVVTVSYTEISSKEKP